MDELVQAVKRSPNIGRPLFDSAFVASSCNTSQCSATRPFSILTISASCFRCCARAPGPQCASDERRHHRARVQGSSLTGFVPADRNSVPEELGTTSALMDSTPARYAQCLRRTATGWRGFLFQLEKVFGSIEELSGFVLQIQNVSFLNSRFSYVIAIMPGVECQTQPLMHFQPASRRL